MKAKPTTSILAILCILSGCILLLESYGYLSGIYRIWPVFPLILGIGFCLLFFRKNRNDAALLGIGIYLVCVSVLFFFLNFTSWGVLTDIWPLFIGFLGFSFLAPIIWAQKRGVFIPIAFFLLFLCGAFLLVFTVDIRLWPISLVLLGICLLLIGKFDRKNPLHS